MPRPRAKKSQPSYRHSHTESHETTSTTSRDASQYDSIGSDVYTNHREPYDDTESVEEVDDEDSIPDIFKGRKKTRFSHIWLPENGEEYTLAGIIRWKCQRCKFPDLSFEKIHTYIQPVDYSGELFQPITIDCSLSVSGLGGCRIH